MCMGKKAVCVCVCCTMNGSSMVVYLEIQWYFSSVSVEIKAIMVGYDNMVMVVKCFHHKIEFSRRHKHTRHLIMDSVDTTDALCVTGI